MKQGNLPQQKIVSLNGNKNAKYKIDINDQIEKLEKLYLLNKDKIISIGECGLDYYYESTGEIKKIQKDF